MGMDSVQVKDKQFNCYLKNGHIRERIAVIANAINADYKGKNPLFIGVLNGAFMFASDLLQKVTIPCEITFVKISSYDGMQSSGELTKLVGLKEDIENRHVIILEDIVDTGFTMSKAIEDLKQKSPASLEIATLLLKPDCLKKNIELKYTGFEIPDKFVVGYGLDYDGFGRNLQDIYQLKDD